MTYRVTYPLITCDAHRDFATETEARKFANDRRNIISEYQTYNSWRLVQVTELADAQVI